MDRYGGAGEEDSPSDPPWTAPGNEGSMWRLGLGGGGSESYPERAEEPDCIYYLRTGACGYGSRCRFNHPRNPPPVLGTEAGDLPERMGQPVCQHFMQTGTCRFGASCKYHHPRQGGGGGGGGGYSSVTPVSLNYMGFPLRPGDKECSYFMRTGQCKFGSTCRYHHPAPPGVQPPSQQFGVVIPRPQLLSAPYIQSPYAYSQMVLPPTMLPYPAWNNSYQASVSGTQPSMGSSSMFGITSLSPSAPAYQSPPSSNTNQQSFPQRPGHPECQYFMRTGDCKFGSSCRFHHPLEAASPNHIGLPLRPGLAPCTHFAQHGFCKVGPAFKFDHSTGSSSLNDNPLTDTPAASLSSPDQQTKLLSSSSIEPKTITSGGSETLAAGVSSSSSSSITSGVSHPEPAETKGDDSAKT